MSKVDENSDILHDLLHEWADNIKSSPLKIIELRQMHDRCLQPINTSLMDIDTRLRLVKGKYNRK